MNDRQTLSIVVPVFNEESVLEAFHARLARVLAQLDFAVEIIYVNDGSTDLSQATLERLAGGDARVSYIDLSRNFGKEIAMTAGLDHAKGDAVVIIDADLQDPPELIPDLVAEWRNGFDVVYATRSSRDGESWMKRTTASLFYRLIQTLSRVSIPADTGDFRLLSRRAVNALLQLREHHRFMKGLFSWIGFPQKAVMYRRDPRSAGKSKFSYWRLWNFAVEGLTSFSTIPLTMATFIGTLIAACSLSYGIYVITKTLLYGDPVRGYPSLMTVILFLGGIQLIFIGLIGEYLGRIFNETKNRPLYFVKGYKAPQAGAASGQAAGSD